MKEHGSTLLPWCSQTTLILWTAVMCLDMLCYLPLSFKESLAVQISQGTNCINILCKYTFSHGCQMPSSSVPCVLLSCVNFFCKTGKCQELMPLYCLRSPEIPLRGIFFLQGDPWRRKSQWVRECDGGQGWSRVTGSRSQLTLAAVGEIMSQLANLQLPAETFLWSAWLYLLMIRSWSLFPLSSWNLLSCWTHHFLQHPLSHTQFNTLKASLAQ